MSLRMNAARLAALTAFAVCATLSHAQGTEDAPVAPTPAEVAQAASEAQSGGRAIPAVPPINETLQQAAQRYQASFSKAMGSAAIQLPDDEVAEDKAVLAQKTQSGDLKIESTQFVVVANVLYKKQTASLWMVDPQGNAELIGAGKTSSGRRGRFDYYLTPNGIFQNASENGNFRAEGTKNEHGIRGYGVKGMRIYDLGWQETYGGWGKLNPAKIRLQMHSTDPTYLEGRLGMPDSKGCVRVHEKFNRFVDTNAVLDRSFEENGPTWVLNKGRHASPYSGSYVVIHRWDGSQELPTEAERVKAAR